MSTHKHIDKICIFVTVFVLLLAILFMNGKALGITVIESEDESNDMFTANDLNSDWDITGATEINLSDEESTIKGNGAYVYNGDIYIAYAGKYILSGELSNGNIIINADGDDKIWLMLDGVSVHCDDDAAIRVEQADKVFLTLASKSENTLSSGSQYKEDVISSGVDGAIYSRDDLTINGDGMLNVISEYQHGIVGNDDLVLTGGTVAVEAVQDGFHANDSVRIKNADINISSGDDGITVSNDDETGFLYIESGNINISSCYEGLEAIDVTIAGGTIDIKATDDGINANGSGSNSAIKITGGDITITNESGRDADGVDSNKDIYISGGKLFISVVGDGSNSAIDYGMEDGGVCEISGGTVIACGGSAMAEGFDSSSSQGFIMYNTSADSGTDVTLENAEDKIILSEKIPYSFSSVVVSTPEMAVGDTYTITVGEASEEITIDNSTNNLGFGADRTFNGDMQRNSGQGGMFDSTENVDNMPPDNPMDSQNSNEAPSGMQAPPDNQGFGGENGSGQDGTPPAPPNGTMPENGGQMSETPDGTNNGGQMSETLDGTNNGDEQSDFSQENGNFGDRPNDNEMQNPKKSGDMSDTSKENNSMEKTDTKNTFSAENIILLCVSAVVLIIGCIIACVFRRR